MTFILLAALMALSIAGKPSILQWVLGFCFISSGLVLCGYVGGLWRGTLKGAQRLNEGFRIPASGQMEKPSYPDTLAGRAVSRAQKVIVSAVLIALGWMLHSGITWAKYSQEHAAWQKSYAVWAARQPKETR